MIENKNFVLQWEDFHISSSNILKKLRKDSDFYDVTLGCTDSNGQVLQAHKAIIASFSTVFRDMLKQYHTSQANHITSLFLRGIPYHHLYAVLDFIYEGEVNMPEDHLNSFLSVAEDLKIAGLSNAEDMSTKLAISNNMKCDPSSPSLGNYLWKESEQERSKALYSFGKYDLDSDLKVSIGKTEEARNELGVKYELQEVKDRETNVALRKARKEKNVKQKGNCNSLSLQDNQFNVRNNFTNDTLNKDFKIKKNKHGGIKLFKSDYYYLINKKYATTIGWECGKRKTFRCRGSVTTDIEMTKIIRNSPHNHTEIEKNDDVE